MLCRQGNTAFMCSRAAELCHFADVPVVYVKSVDGQMQCPVAACQWTDRQAAQREKGGDARATGKYLRRFSAGGALCTMQPRAR